MSAGDPLAGQLRKASQDCEVCIFLATRRSVDSPWCLAEVGAFWGSGKKVLLFMADPDLTDAMLPPQFKGNLMVSDAATLFAAAREEMARQATLAIRPERETFFETSGDYGIEKDWIQLLQETKLSFDVVGLSLSSWRRINGFTKLVKEFANAGCKFRFLLLDPENSILNSLIYLNEVTRESVIGSIIESARYYESLAAYHPNVESRHLKRGIPHFFCTKTDRNAVLVMYLSSQSWGAGPTWKCPVNSPLYRMAAEEFEALWAIATPASNHSDMSGSEHKVTKPNLRQRKRP